MVYLSPFFVMRHFSNITYKLMITDEGKTNALHWAYSLPGVCQCSIAAKSHTKPIPVSCKTFFIYSVKEK